MPVKIVDDNSATSAKDGTIQIGDLHLMTSDYIDRVALVALPPRTVIFKRFSFYFTVAQLKALLDHYEDKKDTLNAIEIAIGVQVPGTKVKCEDEPEKDIADCLAVIVSMTNKDLQKPSNSIGDFVLINGYHSPHEFVDVDMCCPGTKP